MMWATSCCAMPENNGNPTESNGIRREKKLTEKMLEVHPQWSAVAIAFAVVCLLQQFAELRAKGLNNGESSAFSSGRRSLLHATPCHTMPVQSPTSGREETPGRKGEVTTVVLYHLCPLCPINNISKMFNEESR